MVVQVESTNMIGFELSVGDHLVRFSPRGPHKDDLTVRSLPHLTLKGTVQGSRRTMIPSVSLELSVKQVVVDITTDVLNQLLVLQNSFIKVGVPHAYYMYSVALGRSNGLHRTCLQCLVVHLL